MRRLEEVVLCLGCYLDLQSGSQRYSLEEAYLADWVFGRHQQHHLGQHLPLSFCTGLR
jgi:hypothetical protein